jgi:hypothetical protein
MYVYIHSVYIYTVYHENDDDQPSSRSTSWVIFIAIVYGMEGPQKHEENDNFYYTWLLPRIVFVA